MANRLAVNADRGDRARRKAVRKHSAPPAQQSISVAGARAMDPSGPDPAAR